MAELALVLGGWVGGMVVFVAAVYGIMRWSLWRERRRRLAWERTYGARR